MTARSPLAAQHPIHLTGPWSGGPAVAAAGLAEGLSQVCTGGHARRTNCHVGPRPAARYSTQSEPGRAARASGASRQWWSSGTIALHEHLGGSRPDRQDRRFAWSSADRQRRLAPRAPLRERLPVGHRSPKALRRHLRCDQQAGRRRGHRSAQLPAQYLGGELSRRINAEGNAFPVAVAFLSRSYMRSVTFRDPSDGYIESSLIEAGDDMLYSSAQTSIAFPPNRTRWRRRSVHRLADRRPVWPSARADWAPCGICDLVPC